MVRVPTGPISLSVGRVAGFWQASITIVYPFHTAVERSNKTSPSWSRKPEAWIYVISA